MLRKTRFTGVVGSVAAILTLTGCGGGSSFPVGSARNMSMGAAPLSNNSVASQGHGLSSRAGTGSRQTTINETIDDDVMGEHVLVQGLVRDFPAPKSMPGLEHEEIVLVKVIATVDSKFYTSFNPDDLRVITADGTVNAEDNVDGGLLTTAMKAAGYPPLPGSGVEHGTTGGGWVGFIDNQKDSPSLTLRMTRIAEDVMGSGPPIPAVGIKPTVPAKNFDVPLVK